ncbi:MAG TPA: hypothetical protein VFA35_10215 [Burkholderiaceae bacterium]|nr:hypothetical protein [Burkholderiaceae bacterium]
MKTFAVSKVRLDPDGRVTHVYWGEVDTRKNDWAAPEAVAPVIDVVRAIHDGNQVFALFPSTHGHLPERRFIVADYDNGWETIVLDGPPMDEREVHDMSRLPA